MSKEAVISLLGEPESKANDTWSDETMSETWAYKNPNMELAFYSDTDFRLTTITVFTTKAVIDGKNPIGKSESTLLEMLPALKLDDDFEENGKDYVYPGKELSFWVSDGIVNNVTIFPLYDKTGNLPIWPKQSS